MITITVNNKTIEINSAISLKIVSPLFSQQIGFSFPFKIKNTIKNRTALGINKGIEGYKYKALQPATLSTALFSRNFNLVINNIASDIEIQLIETDFYFLHSKKKLPEVFNEEFYVTDYANTIVHPENYEYVFCQIPNSEIANSFSYDPPLSNAPENINHTFSNDVTRVNIPFFKYIYIIEKLFANLGYQINLNDIFKIPDIGKMYLFNNYAINSISTLQTYDRNYFEKNGYLHIFAIYNQGDDIICETESTILFKTNDYLILPPLNNSVNYPNKIDENDIFPLTLLNKRVQVTVIDGQRFKLNETVEDEITYQRKRYWVNSIDQQVFQYDLTRKYCAISTFSPYLNQPVNQTFKRIPWNCRKDLRYVIYGFQSIDTGMASLFFGPNITITDKVEVGEIYNISIPSLNINAEFEILSVWPHNVTIQTEIKSIPNTVLQGDNYLTNNYYNADLATWWEIKNCIGMPSLNNRLVKFIEPPQEYLDTWGADKFQNTSFVEIESNLDLGIFTGKFQCYFILTIIKRNSENLIQLINTIYSYENQTLENVKLANHVPNISVNEFLKSTEDIFGGKFVANGIFGFKFVSFNTVLNKQYKAIIDSNAIVSNIVNKQYDVSIAMHRDGNDTMNGKINDVPAEAIYAGDVLQYANLPTSPENLFYYYVVELNTFYICKKHPLTPDFTWVELSLRGYENIAESINNAQIIQIAPKVQPLLFSDKIRANVKITNPSLFTKNEFDSIRPFFYSYNGAQIVSDETSNISLRMQSLNTVTLNEFAFNLYKAWIKTRFVEYKAMVLWSKLELNSLNFDHVYMVNGTNCLVKEVNLTLTGNEINVTDTYLVKV